MKSGLDGARSAMEDLKIKDLLVETKNWDRAFGDVGEVESNNGEDLVEGDEEIEKGDTKQDKDISTAKDNILSHTVSELDDSECKEVMEDLVDLENEKVIDKAVKENICKYMCKAYTKGSDGKTSISIYHPITHEDDKKDGKKVENKAIRNDKKFIEISHNKQAFFVRKSTLVWLFEEGERVSSDRLFRVRAKQPFSTSIQSDNSLNNFMLPEVKEFIEIGEFCIFLDQSTKDWNIGKVTQFANFKQKLKSNRQFKAAKASVHSEAVGVLCSWFVNKDNSCIFTYDNEKPIDYVSITSYICTLSLSCFEKTKGTDIKGSSIGNLPNISSLLTCNEVVLHKDALRCINKLLLKSETLAKKKAETCQLAENKKGNYKWVTFEHGYLTVTDKHILESGKCLTDKHIDFACALIKKQFPHIGGLQSILLQSSKIHPALTISKDAIQILFLEKEKHWSVISTINCEDGIIHYYDSVYNSISISTQNLIVSLIRPNNDLTVQIKDVGKQHGGTDCGLYSLAYCIALAYDQNPCDYVLSQNEMRVHLLSCFQDRKMSLFPTVRRRRLSSDTIATVAIELCPICYFLIMET